MKESITLYAEPDYPDEYWQELQDVLESRFGVYSDEDGFYINPSMDEESGCYEVGD